MIERLKSAVLDCYHFREVFFNLLSQDLKVKYRRTFFGYIWSLLNPIMQLAVLSVVFSHIVRWEMKNYVLYLFSGTLVWTFFYQSLYMSSRAILENEGFIKKVYLPKMLFPLSKISLRGIDFLFSLIALSLIGLIAGFHLPWTVVFLPFAIIILFLFTLGLSIGMSIFTVYFRDVEYLLSVVLQLLYFATPILYPVTALPEKYRVFLSLNPMYVIIELFHKIIYAGVVPNQAEWMSAMALAATSFALGLFTLAAFEEDLVFRM